MKTRMWMAIIGLAMMVRCFPNETALQGGTYAANLEECNRTARNLCESIKCENGWRARAGRPPRDVPKHCINAEGTMVIVKDGGE